MQFETKRLIIRSTNIDDGAFIYELLNTPKWIKYIGDRNLKSAKDGENYIKEKMIPQLKRLGYSNNTVILKESNTKIGSCGLYNRDGIDGVDIGFAFLPKYEKKGFAFESASELIKFSKKHFNIKKISAITTKENKASQKLILKLGLNFDKIIEIPPNNDEMLLYNMNL